MALKNMNHYYSITGQATPGALWDSCVMCDYDNVVEFATLLLCKYLTSPDSLSEGSGDFSCVFAVLFTLYFFNIL